MTHKSFATTDAGLRRDLPPMVLYEKAKRFGIWNPSDLDFTQDRADWERLDAEQRDILLRLTSMFVTGEEAVTIDLLPLITAVAQDGRLEEELYLTTFLFEEAKHTDFFHRFLEEVTGDTSDLSRYHGPNYKTIFYSALPDALDALRRDPSSTALARAATTYNMVVEGILAETGYHAYFSVLDTHTIFPGQRQGVHLTMQDESRHLAYGVYLLSRLMAEDHSLWSVVEETMNELLVPALGVITEAFAAYDTVPFGLRESEFTEFATRQFQKRLDRIQRARGLSLDEVNHASHATIRDNDS